MNANRRSLLLGLAALAAAPVFADRPRATDLKIVERTATPDQLSFAIEGDDAEVVQMTKRFFLEPLARRLCASGPESCESTTGATSVDVRRKWVVSDLKAKVKAKVLGCFAAWAKTIRVSDHTRLLTAVVPEPSYRQTGYLETLGKDFADYVSRFYEGCEESTAESAFPFLWHARGYWALKVHGEGPTIEAREYVSTFSKLFDGPFESRVVTTIANQRKAFRARVDAAFAELAKIGFPEDHKFDEGVIFEAIREGRVKTMAELAVATLSAYASVETGVEESIRGRDIARLSPIAWVADVLLSRCKARASLVDSGCGTSPETKFRWARLRLPERSVKFLLPRWQSPETADSLIPDLGPFLFLRNRR